MPPLRTILGVVIWGGSECPQISSQACKELTMFQHWMDPPHADACDLDSVGDI